MPLFDESKHPRDEHGRWTDSGGGDDHPGEGYSKEARIKDGVVHTSNVYDAARALHEGKKVELDQPRGLSTLIDKLGEISKEMIAKGKEVPNYNLCNVTIRGSNLFCADAKGIPRVKMPQLGFGQEGEFQKYLADKGHTVTEERQFVANLRATQSELSSEKVLSSAEFLRDDPNHQANPIFVSRDDYILDGHHRWAAKIGLDAADNILGNDTKMDIIRVDMSITELLEEAETFTGGKGKVSMGKALLARTSAHTDWMNECVPAMMDAGRDQIVAVAACLNMWREAWEEAHPDGADDPGPSPKEADEDSPLAEEKQLQLARGRLRAWNEADHPRDEDGKFTDSGGGDEAASVWDRERPLTNVDAEKELARRDPKRLAALAEKTAKKLDFDPANIEWTDEHKEFKLGEQKYNYAGSYRFGDSKIKLYSGQLNVDNVAGVTAHEIGHRKFQLLMEYHKAESAMVMKEPGPPPDPNHRYWWGKKGGSDAVMAPDGSLRKPYDEYYPIYQEWNRIQNMRPSLEQDDGVSPYSEAYWKEWEKGDMKTDIAYHETIAEMTRAMDKFNAHAIDAGKGWRDLYTLTDKVWKDTDELTRNTSLVPPEKAAA